MIIDEEVALSSEMEIIYIKLQEDGDDIAIFDYDDLMANIHIAKNEILVYSVVGIALVSGDTEDIEQLRALLIH